MNREMYVYKSVAESRITNVHHIIHSALTGSRSPAGPRRLGTATLMSASLSRGSLRSLGAPPTKAQKRQSWPFYPRATQGFRNVRNAPRVVIPPPSETAPVSPCEPLCAILLRKPSVYPLSLVKANVGRFAGDCDKSFFAVWYPLMEVGDGCL